MHAKCRAVVLDPTWLPDAALTNQHHRLGRRTGCVPRAVGYDTSGRVEHHAMTAVNGVLLASHDMYNVSESTGQFSLPNATDAQRN